MSTHRRAPEGEKDSDPRAEPGEHLSQAPPSGFRQGEKGKVSGSGWTVTDQFERDGFRYRLMRRPLLLADGGPPLTRREEEALAHAYNGYSNKRIAQALGVAPSTVGVLLFRAAAKLGVKSRRDLLLAYEQLVLRSQSNIP